MSSTTKLPNLMPIIVNHAELKLIGIPCISLTQMGDKYHNAKEGLLSSTKYLPHVVNDQIHYGMWPTAPSQSNPDTHAYILCVEVESFEGIPDWYLKLTVPAQQCVVVAEYNGNFDAAGEVIDAYIRDKGLNVSAGGFQYTVCERYSYEGEGFARYSLPII